MSRRARHLCCWAAPLGAALLLGALLLLRPPRCTPSPETPPRPARGGLYLFNGCEVHDADFVKIHTFPGDFCRYLPSGEILSFVTGSGLLLFDADLKMRWRLDVGDVHHHIAAPPAGPLYVLSSHDDHVYRGKRLRFDVVLKVSRRGRILARWCTFDHLETIKRSLPFKHPAEDDATGGWDDSRIGGPYGKGEYFHVNHVDVLPPNPNSGKGRAFAPGNLLLSFPLFQMLAILDPETYEFLWTYTLDPARSSFGQHCAQMLPSGNVLVFVNGLKGRGGKLHSSVVELDPVTKRTVWRYLGSPPESFYSELLGCAQRLRDGNTLITVGDMAPPAGYPYVLEVTPRQEVVRRYAIGPGSAFLRKARRLQSVTWAPRAALADILPLSAQ